MKKIVLVFAGLLAVAGINSQSLQEIVRKHNDAIGQEKKSLLKSIRITGNISVAGMDLPLVIWMKNPDKIRTVTNANGQEIISVFDGVKGYQINPMTGSDKPTEMTPEQVKQTIRNNIFQNQLMAHFRNGQLSLDGEDKVNDKPAFRLKTTVGGEPDSYIYIDKSSYLIVREVSDIVQNGSPVTVVTNHSDYSDNEGIILPMKTITSVNDMEVIITFTRIETNLAMEDSIFSVR
jgi:hypothetical protein